MEKPSTAITEHTAIHHRSGGGICMYVCSVYTRAKHKKK